MHFGFNNQFIKVKRTLTNISKNIKKYFCLVLIPGITNLYVKRIPSIKKLFFNNLLRFFIRP
jgi:hypothetical protein